MRSGPAQVIPFAPERRTYALVDPVLARTLEFVSSGDREVAVWTPGPAPSSESLSRQTSHFLPDEWRGFVAVENGLLRRESEVQVPPGGFCLITRTVRETGASGLRPSGVTVRNCAFKMKACPQSARLMRLAVPESAGGYPAGSMFGVITPAYGAFVRHADGVVFENVRFDLVGGDDARKEIHREP